VASYEIDAAAVDIASDVELGAGCVIRAERVVLKRGARVGAGVEIVADAVELDEGACIGPAGRVMAPIVRLGAASTLGVSLQAQLNDHLVVGAHSTVGHRVAMGGRGVTAGDYLWMKDDVVIGGGGALGPRSFLTIGDRTTIIDKCFLNVSEEVRIGSDTALSFNVAVLTHGAWQPVLLGYRAKFGAVQIGNNAVVYLNAVILPGVTVGDYSTVAAMALVTDDVPPYCLVVGNPAKIQRGPDNYPPPLDAPARDAIIRTILHDYVATLEPKGVRVLDDSLETAGGVTVQYDGSPETLCYATSGGTASPDGDIVLSYGPLRGSARAHFDLLQQTVSGTLTPVGEDLRDYLRRRCIRIYTNGPFRAIPLANLRRLRRRKDCRD
jgi:acetyltransferase-like isoleucine patch superfamily enzyme